MRLQMTDGTQSGACPTPGPSPGSAPDDRIIECLRQGREEGIAMLVLKYAPQMRAYLLKRWGRHREPAIDDAISKATYSVWQHIDTFDPSRLPLRWWFLLIARNALVTELRADQLVRLVAGTGQDLDIASRPCIDPDRSERQQALVDDVRYCIGLLGPLQQDIILSDLARGESAEGVEIARRWNTSLNSVHASRNKAHNRLRKLLKKRGHRL